jgi:hypothetical protein
MKRHIAKLVNTDQKVVVAFMQIPDREDHALVIPSDNLPTRWEQLIQTLVESNEGQSIETFGELLGRRMMPDSTESVLMSLVTNNMLVPVPINQVIMFPRPNQPIPLREVLKAMGRVVPTEEEVAQAAAAAAQEKFNPHTTNQKADVSAADVGIAEALLIEADMLEEDARSKRERAYQYAPHLRPKKGGDAPTMLTEAAPAKAPAKPRAKTSTTSRRAAPKRAKKANGAS